MLTKILSLLTSVIKTTKVRSKNSPATWNFEEKKPKKKKKKLEDRVAT